jgi:hypothetical protein
MTDCIHVHLIKQVGPMDGGEQSTRYRCEACGENFYVKPSELGGKYGRAAIAPGEGK